MMGLTPCEVYELELWEFNLIVDGYNQQIIEKEKNIIKQAYYTASFSNAKKVKSLEYYLNNIDRAINMTDKSEEKKKIEFAKRMAKNGQNNKI